MSAGHATGCDDSDRLDRRITNFDILTYRKGKCRRVGEHCFILRRAVSFVVTARNVRVPSRQNRTFYHPFINDKCDCGK